ncbi:prepilin-type N-terminal cleavage/methylation domain-containing protein [Candidatus Gracilibacteria bacterium]|nr:prepilin-type N-terminal cleavage/methylation domain-containing protein [Candidatus Gracilibacteria bacterium]
MNQFSKNIKKRGFTLVELMIVITIIVTLTGIGFFPFSYYLERARVEKNTDNLAQEWLILHEDIRNGLLYDSLDPISQHAHLFATMKKDDNFIDIEVATGSSEPKKFYKRITLDKPLRILSFSGGANGANQVIYHLTPPFATGAYSVDANPPTSISTGIIIEIGYQNATLSSGRAKQILLRPRYN